MSRGKKYFLLRKQIKGLFYPLTFCPPGALNEPLDVPLDCRQPLCIGIGAAVLVGSTLVVVLLLLLSFILQKQS